MSKTARSNKKDPTVFKRQTSKKTSSRKVVTKAERTLRVLDNANASYKVETPKRYDNYYTIKVRHANGYIEDDVKIGFNGDTIPTPYEVFREHYGYHVKSVEYQRFNPFHPTIALYPEKINLFESFPESYIDGSDSANSYFVVRLFCKPYRGKK